MICCGANLTFVSVVFNCRWLEVLEQEEAVFFRVFPKQWCTMILIETGQYRRMPQIDCQYRPLLGLKFSLVVYHNYKVYSGIGGIRLQ